MLLRTIGDLDFLLLPPFPMSTGLYIAFKVLFYAQLSRAVSYGVIHRRSKVPEGSAEGLRGDAPRIVREPEPKLTTLVKYCKTSGTRRCYLLSVTRGIWNYHDGNCLVHCVWVLETGGCRFQGL